MSSGQLVKRSNGTLSPLGVLLRATLAVLLSRGDYAYKGIVSLTWLC